MIEFAKVLQYFWTNEPNCIQLETKQVEHLINTVKDSKELYELATEEYQNKVLIDYKGQSVLSSKYGLAWKDVVTPLVYGPFTTIFESPTGSFILVYETVEDWTRIENSIRKFAFEFFMEHERKHVLDWKNFFYRYQMRKAYTIGQENFKIMEKFEMRADKSALDYIKQTYPDEMVIKTLMFVYKFLNMNTNDFNQNIRAHKEFALKFLVNDVGLLSRAEYIKLIKKQTEQKYSQIENRLESMEKRLKVIGNEIQTLSKSALII